MSRKRLSDGKRQRVSHVDVSGNNVPGRGARTGKNRRETVPGIEEPVVRLERPDQTEQHRPSQEVRPEASGVGRMG